jgi:hypothetical protein
MEEEEEEENLIPYQPQDELDRLEEVSVSCVSTFRFTILGSQYDHTLVDHLLNATVNHKLMLSCASCLLTKQARPHQPSPIMPAPTADEEESAFEVSEPYSCEL